MFYLVIFFVAGEALFLKLMTENDLKSTFGTKKWAVVRDKRCGTNSCKITHFEN
jgi:hypothetical protein